MESSFGSSPFFSRVALLGDLEVASLGLKTGLGLLLLLLTLVLQAGLLSLLGGLLVSLLSLPPGLLLNSHLGELLGLLLPLLLPLGPLLPQSVDDGVLLLLLYGSLGLVLSQLLQLLGEAGGAGLLHGLLGLSIVSRLFR